MRIILTTVAMLFTSTMASAGVLDDLRELRGTISEGIQTKREVSEAGKELTPVNTAEAQANQPSGTVKSGDVLVGKITSIKLYSDANKKSKFTKISSSDELVFMGDETNGLYHVTTADGEGWVDKLLVKKH